MHRKAQRQSGSLESADKIPDEFLLSGLSTKRIYMKRMTSPTMKRGTPSPFTMICPGCSTVSLPVKTMVQCPF